MFILWINNFLFIFLGGGEGETVIITSSRECLKIRSGHACWGFNNIQSLNAFVLTHLIVRTSKRIYEFLVVFTAACSALGITVGAHRLWSHRCYNARVPMRLLLALFQTMAFQNHIYEWVRDHRVHHKFCDTDADPHNSSRGFFFSHMGWLMIRKHADVSIKGRTVDMADLEADPIVMWQKKWDKVFFFFSSVNAICLLVSRVQHERCNYCFIVLFVKHTSNPNVPIYRHHHFCEVNYNGDAILL